MPHKYNADRRHHISRPKRRVTKECNEALRQRGSLTGIVKLLGGSRGLGELNGKRAGGGLCGQRDAADVVPRLEGAGPLGAVVGCNHAVAGRKRLLIWSWADRKR